MGYFISIDGGGSKTELVISNDKGEIKAYIKAKGTNPISAGEKKSIEVLENILKTCFRIIDQKSIDFISIGIPGIKRCIYLTDILDTFIKNGNIDISGDEKNIFYGTLGEKSGIVICSGTGSFAIGKNKAGQQLSIGGWGPLVGDEGSGYFMGIRAIQAVISEYEGLGMRTILTSNIKKYFNIDDINELKRELYRNGLDAGKIAFLSRYVLSGVIEKDKICIDILEESILHLFNLSSILIQRLNMYEEDYFLSLNGGISNFGDYIYKALQYKISEAYNNFTLIKPLFKPVIGGIIYGFNRRNIKITDTILNNLKCSLEGVDEIAIK